MTIDEEEQLCAEIKLICKVVKGLHLPANTPMGEIFNLLRSQTKVTAAQREALRLWDTKHSFGVLVQGRGMVFPETRSIQ